MNTEIENNIITEFEKQRKQMFESNEPNDDFKIIQNIANNLNIKFLEVLKIIDIKKSNRPQSNHNSIILEFDKQRKYATENKTSTDDNKIIHNIAESLNMSFSEVLNIIENSKNNIFPMGYIKTFPIA